MFWGDMMFEKLILVLLMGNQFVAILAAPMILWGLEMARWARFWVRLVLSDNFLAFLTWCGNNQELGAFLYSLIFAVGAVLCLPEIALAAVSGFLFRCSVDLNGVCRAPGEYMKAERMFVIAE